MDSDEGLSIAAAFEHQFRSGAPAAQIAGTVAAVWGHFEQALIPIIGPLGVAALYHRSLVLTGRSHPWLAGLREGVQETVDVEALTAALAQQKSGDAALAGGELLQTFYDLLTRLIGAPLTHKLLVHMSNFLTTPVHGTPP